MPSPLERLRELLGDRDPVPKKLTIEMGKRVKQAREDAGLSQSELGSRVHRRRATISDIENGKSELTVTTLALLAAALDKPIAYFMPWYVHAHLRAEELEPSEQELLLQFRKIWTEDLQQLAIRQVKQIADTDLENHPRKQPRQAPDPRPDNETSQ